MIHPELCRVSPPESGANLDLPGDWVGGWMDLRDERRHDVARRRRATATTIERPVARPSCAR